MKWKAWWTCGDTGGSSRNSCKQCVRLVFPPTEQMVSSGVCLLHTSSSLSTLVKLSSPLSHCSHTTNTYTDAHTHQQIAGRRLSALVSLVIASLRNAGARDSRATTLPENANLAWSSLKTGVVGLHDCLRLVDGVFFLYSLFLPSIFSICKNKSLIASLPLVLKYSRKALVFLIWFSISVVVTRWTFDIWAISDRNIVW